MLKTENKKGKVEKLQNEERTFFFFFFFFHFSKPLKLVLGLPKWKLPTGIKHFTQGKIRKNNFNPSKKKKKKKKKKKLSWSRLSAGRRQSDTTQNEQATQHRRLLQRRCCPNHGSVGDMRALHFTLGVRSVYKRTFQSDYRLPYVLSPIGKVETS